MIITSAPIFVFGIYVYVYASKQYFKVCFDDYEVPSTDSVEHN